VGASAALIWGANETAARRRPVPPEDHDPNTVCEHGSVTDASPPTSGVPRRHVVVVGAGIAGLTAAHALMRDGRVRVTVLESAPRTGGKLHRGEIAGHPTDLGAESVLARRPEAVALLTELGLPVVSPVTTSASLWSRRQLRPFPAGQVMGVPTDLRSLASSGVVSRVGVARAALDQVLPATAIGDDRSVASFVGARLGREVVDRLVEPLLGGIYAGRAEELSLRATLPQVANAAPKGSLLRALRPDRSAQPDRSPVFAGVAGGLGQLAEALTAGLSAGGVAVVLDAAVRDLTRRPTGWRLIYGSAANAKTIDADAVVLALPATPASRLLANDAPSASVELAAIDYASMAVVTMAFAANAFEKPFAGSGFLVPAVERLLIKAATVSTSKWGWYSPDAVIVRCSIGRYGEVADLQRPDNELIAGALRDLARCVGIRGVPIESAVTRWGGALPQYNVGHLDRVARIKAAVEAVPGLAVCGAAFDGVGIPACIASGRAAATRVMRQLFGEGE